MKEASVRAETRGKNDINYWFNHEIELNDETDFPAPHERPISNVKVSFVWAFYYLKNNYTFERALRDIVKRGGDTSANAAIVGGLIGALHGIDGISRGLY